jgi:hypothetical protein
MSAKWDQSRVMVHAMTPSRRGATGYDVWNRGWLIAAHPTGRRRPAVDSRLPAPTVGLLTQLRSYLNGTVPG